MPSGQLLVLTASQSRRFWGQVKIGSPDECWPWIDRLHADGTGRINIRGIVFKGSQLSYLIHWGQHPYPNLYVCHFCDNRRCVNPLHLWLGTAKENSQDARRKSRSTLGMSHPQARLSPTQAKSIFALNQEGLSQQQIAKKLGIKQPQVSRILTGKRWAAIQKEYVLF